MRQAAQPGQAARAQAVRETTRSADARRGHRRAGCRRAMNPHPVPVVAVREDGIAVGAGGALRTQIITTTFDDAVPPAADPPGPLDTASRRLRTLWHVD